MTHAEHTTRPRQETGKVSPKREPLEKLWGGGTPTKGGFQLNKSMLKETCAQPEDGWTKPRLAKCARIMHLCFKGVLRRKPLDNKTD